VELAREHRPDLVLLDVHLPDIDGDEVLRRLRADEVTAGVPVVIVSADATPGQVGALLASGAARYLTKPVRVAALLRVLDELLG
jgi:CheY-like chemotaxis protein